LSCGRCGGRCSGTGFDGCAASCHLRLQTSGTGRAWSHILTSGGVLLRPLLLMVHDGQSPSGMCRRRCGGGWHAATPPARAPVANATRTAARSRRRSVKAIPWFREGAGSAGSGLVARWMLALEALRPHQEPSSGWKWHSSTVAAAPTSPTPGSPQCWGAQRAQRTRQRRCHDTPSLLHSLLAANPMPASSVFSCCTAGIINYDGHGPPGTSFRSSGQQRLANT
jgi:hypothetical protein